MTDMTPNLLDELEGVAGSRYSEDDVRACAKRMKFYDHQIAASILTEYADRMPALADMAKRLEAAERKIGRLTAMRNEWERDAREHLMTFGQHLPASVECLVERFDAATQEGEG